MPRILRPLRSKASLPESTGKSISQKKPLICNSPWLRKLVKHELEEEQRKRQVFVVPQFRGAVAKITAGETGRRTRHGLAVSGDDADRGFGEQVTLHSHHTQSLIGNRPASLCLHAEHPQSVGSRPTAEFGSAKEINRLAVVGNANPPTKKGNDDQRARGRGKIVHCKVTRIFEEELTFFRKKYRKASQIDLGLVH